VDRPADGQAVADELTAYLNGVQERLQAAEIERAAAQARAGAERRARRLTLGLAALALGVVVLGSASWLWLREAGQARRGRTARQVNEAIGKATLLRDRARELLTKDSSRWREAQASWRDALGAAQQAEKLLATGEGDEELEHRVRELRNEIEPEAAQAEKDRRMADALATIRIRKRDVRDSDFDFTHADEEYQETFLQYGINLEKMSVEQAAAQIRGRSIQAELAAALDDWSLVLILNKPRSPVSWERPIEVAIAADADLRRKQIRQALLTSDLKLVRETITAANLADLPAPTVELLAIAVARLANMADAVALLRRLQVHHPNDFWINTDLAMLLHLGLKPPQLDEAIGYYKAALALRSQDAGAYQLLGEALIDKGAFDEAITTFHQAIRLKPDLAVAYYNLADALTRKGAPTEAAQALEQVIRLKPKLASGHFALGNAFARQEDFEKAVAAYREALRLQPDLAGARIQLNAALARLQAPGDDIKACREAVRRNPKSARAHLNLGKAFLRKGLSRQAIAACKEAIQLQPDLVEAYDGLGSAQLQLGATDDAIATYREAVRRRPDSAAAHDGLGSALEKKEAVDEAIASYQQALRIKPDLCSTYINLGRLLCDRKRDYDGAADAFREAIRLEPGDAIAHYNLGMALINKGTDDKAAIAAYQQAIRLRPGYAKSHHYLGLVLLRQGRIGEALASLKQARQLSSADPGFHAICGQAVRECERLAELDGKLPGVLSGKEQVTDPSEKIGYAVLCFLKRLHATSTRYYQEAFNAQPDLMNDMRAGNRFRAARAAALAGTGRGEDAAKVGNPERVKLRRQALTWLRADLVFWTKLVKENPNARTHVHETLRHWQTNPDLAGMREADALAKLPADERPAFTQLWADVAALLKKAQEKSR
jgi:tetratricopeptide (TPR) repeat protein